MKTRHAVLLPFFLFLCIQFAPAVTVGADYPEKPIRVLVGLGAGGVADLSLRALLRTAEKYVKQPMVVVNKPGASQTIALTELVASPPDGYTIAMATDGYKALTIHQQKLRFDPKAIRMLLGYARYRHVLFVRGDSPYARYDDFIALGKSNPAAMNYGGPGEGTAPDLIGKVFFRDVNIRPTYVPFKGSAEYVVAIMGGHLLSGIVDISGVAKEVEAGTLKLVVVFGDQRLKEFPQVPSSKEKGHSDLNLLNANLGIALHRDTPADRVAFLHDALRKAVEDPEFKKAADSIGLQALYTDPQALEEGIRNTERIGVPLLKELNLFVE